jgi:hypothetical protein
MSALDPFDFGSIWQRIPGTDMRRVTQMRLYRLGALSRLRDLVETESYEEFFNRTAILSLQLREFAADIEYQQTVPSAVERARNLFEALRDQYKSHIAPNRNQIENIQNLLRSFENSLDDDLKRLPTFIVDPVGAYSFDQLINHADTVFPPSFRDGAIIPPKAIEDFREAGKCLAFDVPTACGFHVFRAADAMIRAYYSYFVVGATPPKKEPRDWGKYIDALRNIINDPAAARKPNIRTVELLDSIRATDRNPVIHPEQDLDKDTALATFDLCKNVILLMALDIKASP